MNGSNQRIKVHGGDAPGTHYLAVSAFSDTDQRKALNYMCISPNQLNDGTLIACRECWQCRERRILDWQGRCIAESKTSVGAYSMTLTYGRGQNGKDLGKVSHPRAHILTYSDVQKFFKRLRRKNVRKGISGYKFKYFAVGEFGSKKGRAHWHVIVFWSEDMPEVPFRENFNWDYWPHGFAYIDDVGPASVRYNCKYLNKDLEDAERQGHLAMSKKPPLGSEYFAHLAQQYVDARLSPQDLFYSFPEALDKEGKKLKFLLSGRSADLFCEAYLRLWREQVGKHYPPSEVIEEYEDRMARNQPERLEDLAASLKNKVPLIKISPPSWMPEGVESMAFDEQRNSFYVEIEGHRYWWSYDKRGKRAWENIIRKVDLEKIRPRQEAAHAAYLTRTSGRWIEYLRSMPH